MQEQRFFPYYLKYSILCTLAYCVPVYFFFKHEKFSQLWLLYLGNMCFGVLLLISGVFVNKKLHNSASIKSMITPGLKVIAASIILSCVAVAALALIFKDSIMQQAPTNYNGLYYLLPLNVIVVNFLLGTFAVTIGAFAIKTNQRNAKGEEIT